MKPNTSVLYVSGKKARMVPGYLVPNGLVVRLPGMFPRYEGWLLTDQVKTQILLEEPTGLTKTRLEVKPMFACVRGHATPLGVVIPEVDNTLEGSGRLLDNIRTTSGAVNNETLAKLIRGQVAEAYVDKSKGTIDMIFGMVFGGMYTLIFARPDLFQDSPWGMVILFGLMFAMFFMMGRR